MLDLTIGGIPPDHVLLPAANPIGICDAVQEVMAELVRQGEIDPSSRTDRIIVDDAPPLAPSGRPEECAVEIGKIVTGDTYERIIREFSEP